MIPSLLQTYLNLLPMYLPPLSILIFFTSAFFCQSNHTMYFLKDSVTILHSMSLRKSMLTNLVLRSIHVIKYLYPPMDTSKGPHRSETIMLPMFDGRSSVFLNGAQVCLPYGQLLH